MAVRLVSYKYLSSVNVCPRGQDAASIGHHCANTNVSGQAVMTFRTTDKEDNEKNILDRNNFNDNNFNINGTI